MLSCSPLIDVGQTFDISGKIGRDLLPRERSVKDLQSEVLLQNRILEDSILRFEKKIGKALGYEDEKEEVAIATGLDDLYKDSWPDCEVTVAIIEVMSFDLVGTTFDAEFDIHLDWKDPQLRRGIHYDYNAERGKFELMQSLRNCTNDMCFFNPKIIIANSKTEPEEAEHLPDILDEEYDEAEKSDIPWLHKQFKFLGTLSCRHVNARYFPFDIITLHIKITAADMTGSTSVGKPRRLRLLEPHLRKEDRLRRKRHGRPLAGYAVAAGQEDDVMPHMWSIDTSGGDSRDVGELRIIAMGGVVDSQEGEPPCYNFAMVLKRNWYPRYFFDIVIYNLQTVTALFSILVPFNVDQLANRMSITLTVLLTVVGVSGSRPPVIADLPYQTLHDMYGQLMVFAVLLVGLVNLIVFQNCWGMYREPAVDDVYDPVSQMVVANFREDGVLGEWWCQQGKGLLGCGASNLDCMLLIATMVMLLSLLTHVFLSSQLYRVTSVLRVKHLLDVHDMHGELQYSRLVLCHGEGFELVRPRNMLAFGHSVSLLPFPTCFWRCWNCTRRCRKGCCPYRCRGSFFQPGEEIEAVYHLAHPLDSELELDYAIHAFRKTDHNDSMSRMNLKLSPYDVFRVLDVGSGEIGFYSYYLDPETRCIKTTGTEDKFKYAKGMTFVDQFLGAKEDEGVSQFTQEIISRFNLQKEKDEDVPRLLSESMPAPLNSSCDDPRRQSEKSVSQSRAESKKSMFDSFDAATSHKGGPIDAKNKLLMAFTGQNRQMLTGADKAKYERLCEFIEKVNGNLLAYELQIVSPYAPEDVDEALFELWATGWVVKHGDLKVQDSPLSKMRRAYKTLQRGNDDAVTNLKEVCDTFRDLNAEPELKKAFDRATISDQVVCKDFYDVFERSGFLMCALVRAKMFTGTLSAGSGSSQVTLRHTSQVYSLPMGNRTPMVSMEISGGRDVVSILSKKLPRTREVAKKLFQIEDDSCLNTTPCWKDDGIVEQRRLELWRHMIETCAGERELPHETQGLFVGISAIFYAAKAAGCAEKILVRDDFVGKLESKVEELMQNGGVKGRDIANLSLVASLVKFVLHKSSFIVCKRNWKVGEGGGEKVDFVATWTLGMYLKHSGVLGVPLRETANSTEPQTARSEMSC